DVCSVFCFSKGLYVGKRDL
ncbi:hypothetical protein AZZ92_003983, partial [Escherichia coli]